VSESSITRIQGRRLWDSRGRPTIEIEITTASGKTGRAIAPAGASKGSGEAVDLRDGGQKFDGYDVTNALNNIKTEIRPALLGQDVYDQLNIDQLLIDLDGTGQKERLGGNALIATSMAAAHAAASTAGLPLWKYLGGNEDSILPTPEIQIFGGGAHAGNRVDIQDFMCIAVGARTFAQALDWTAEVYRMAGRLLEDAGKLKGVADEGGYWPDFASNEEGLMFLARSIEEAGLRTGEDMAISLDIAASQFREGNHYVLSRDGRKLGSGELIELLAGWISTYPIVSVEDPLSEHDRDGFKAFTKRFGDKIQIVGDDYLVTSAERVEKAIEDHACNSVLIKPNQAGTLSETRAAFEKAGSADWGSIISARSGESEDCSIVHIGTGWGIKQIKVGSFSRSERMAKWNEALRISEQLDNAGALHSSKSFPWGDKSHKIK